MLTFVLGSSTIADFFVSSTLKCGAAVASVSFLAATALGAELPPQMPLGVWCPKEENIQTAALFEPTCVLLPSGDVCRYKSTVGTWGTFLAEARCTHMPDGSRVSITRIGDTISSSGMVGRIVVGRPTGPGAEPPGDDIPEAARRVFPAIDRIMARKVVRAA